MRDSCEIIEVAKVIFAHEEGIVLLDIISALTMKTGIASTETEAVASIL